MKFIYEFFVELDKLGFEFFQKRAFDDDHLEIYEFNMQVPIWDHIGGLVKFLQDFLCSFFVVQLELYHEHFLHVARDFVLDEVIVVLDLKVRTLESYSATNLNV